MVLQNDISIQKFMSTTNSIESGTATYILNKLKDQTISFLVICVLSYFFYSELQEVKEDLRDCNQERIELLESLINIQKSN